MLPSKEGAKSLVVSDASTGIVTNLDHDTLSMHWKNAFKDLESGEVLKAFANRQPGMLPYAI